MAIILAGNIATGKTTIARRIMALAPAFFLVGIDEFRAGGRSEEHPTSNMMSFALMISRADCFAVFCV
jgi:adenylate kinase family enzyme